MAKSKATQDRERKAAAGAGGVAAGVVGTNVGAAMHDVGTAYKQQGRASARFNRIGFKSAQASKTDALRRGVETENKVKRSGKTTLGDRQYLKDLGDTWKRNHEFGQQTRKGIKSAHDTIRRGAKLQRRGLITAGAGVGAAAAGIGVIHSAQPPKRKRVKKSMEFAKKDDGYKKKKDPVTTGALAVGAAGGAAGLYGGNAAQIERKSMKDVSRSIRNERNHAGTVKDPAFRRRLKDSADRQAGLFKQQRKNLKRFTNVKRVGYAAGALGAGAAIGNHLKPIDRKRNPT